MKRVILNIFTALVIVCFTSCSKWLDVQPKTSVPGEELFTKESGFKDALTGCYLKMTDSRLYGDNLTFGYVEVLSGVYNNYPKYTTANWNTLIWEHDDYFKSTKDGIYSSLYNVIVNLNNILGYLEKNRDVIKTKGYYENIKGEALALRAYLHFDLLRLFGPVYSVDANGKSIPYRVSFDSEATPILSAKDVVTNILRDLDEANRLLSEFDTNLFRTSDNDEYNADQFLVQRQMRMNQYAVKALLARVYCYCGDSDSKAKAVGYAKEVIESGYFNLYESRSNGILYEEHIFAISSFELYKSIITSFPSEVSNAVPLNNEYYLTEGYFKEIFEIGNGGDTDWRAGQGAFGTRNEIGEVYKLCRKYEQDNLPADYGKDAIPLIRLPEMYFIIAECGSPQESADALNTVRGARGISYDLEIIADGAYDKPQVDDKYDPSQTYRTNVIRNEIRKEYFAEGMLFYFYKRHNFKSFPGCAFTDVTDKYKLPLPDDEISFGNNN